MDITESAYRDGDVEAAYWSGKVMESFLNARIFAAEFLIRNDAKSYERSISHLAALKPNFESLKRKLDNPLRIKLAQQGAESIERYRATLEQVRNVIDRRNDVIKDELDKIGPDLANKIEKLKLSLKTRQDMIGPQIEAEINEAAQTMQAISIATIILAILAAWTVGKAIARPVVSMTGAMSALADGDTKINIPATDHRDEVGDMAKAVEVFRNNKIKADALAEEERRIQKQLADAHALITESIDYASGIQRAMLPDDNMLSQRLGEHFVLWRPRDVVSGDFYWCKRWGDGTVFVVADCTGHGVPGAFVTMIAEGALERAIAGIEPGALGTLVQRTHQLVQAALNQDSEGGDSDDGLELGACYLPDDGGRLKFTGARFDLFTLHNGETEQIKGTKAGLGYRRYDQDQSYEEHDVDIRPGTSCYLTSDGLIDQIGGEKRRSFGKRRFLALLVDLERRPMAEKAAEVEKALIAYQGDNTRRDDITVAGFAL